ncbi:MAG: hypothetical protein V4592_25970 [Bacteroidota bacterium]
MEASYYIFADSRASFAMASIAAFAFVMTGVIIIKVYFNEWEGYNRSERWGMVAKVVSPMAIGIAIFIGSYRNSKYYDRIWGYGKITYGTTIKINKPHRGQPSVEYRFTINNKVYTSSIGYYYEGGYIDSIKAPLGRYRVIYNRKDPTESVMDFKIPEEEK